MLKRRGEDMGTDIFKISISVKKKYLTDLYFPKQKSNFNCNTKTNKRNKQWFNWFALKETLLQQEGSLNCLWTNVGWE